MRNIDVGQARETLMKLLLFINICCFIAGFFCYSQTFLFVVLFTNIIILSMFFLMQSNEHRVDGVILGNKFAGKVNNLAGRING